MFLSALKNKIRLFFFLGSNTAASGFTTSKDIPATKSQAMPFGFSAPTSTVAGNEKGSFGFGIASKESSKEKEDSNPTFSTGISTRIGTGTGISTGIGTGAGSGLFQFGSAKTEKNVDEVQGKKSEESLAEKFKPPAGSWSCKECFIRNEADGKLNNFLKSFFNSFLIH